MAGTPLTAVPQIGGKTEEKLRKKLDRSMGKAGQPVSVNEATMRKNTQVVQFVLSKRQQQELQQFDPSKTSETIDEASGFSGSRAEQRQQAIEEGETSTDGDLTRVDQFDEALDIFAEEYQGATTFTGPDPTEIREGVEESNAPDEFVGLVPSAVNQRSFLQFPNEDKFEETVKDRAGREDAVEPAKEGFVEYVDQTFGLGSGMLTVGEFEVSESDQEEAREAYNEQSPEAKQVDSRRRAPITTDADRYEKRPGELDFPGIDTPSESPQVKKKDRNTVDADDTTLEENTGSLFIRENKTAGGTIGSLKGLFPNARSADRGVTNQAEQVAEDDVGANTNEPSGGSAVADVMFLERDKDGFGEELIPFAAEGSDRNSFEF